MFIGTPFFLAYWGHCTIHAIPILSLQNGFDSSPFLLRCALNCPVLGDQVHASITTARSPDEAAATRVSGDLHSGGVPVGFAASVLSVPATFDAGGKFCSCSISPGKISCKAHWIRLTDCCINCTCFAWSA